MGWPVAAVQNIKMASRADKHEAEAEGSDSKPGDVKRSHFNLGLSTVELWVRHLRACCWFPSGSQIVSLASRCFFFFLAGPRDYGRLGIYLANAHAFARPAAAHQSITHPFKEIVRKAFVCFVESVLRKCRLCSLTLCGRMVQDTDMPKSTFSTTPE